MLTDTLKKDHEVIIKTLLEVSEFGIGSKEGQASLFSAKQSLLSHLEKEDNEFYPFLRKEAEKDIKLANTLDKLSEDMEIVSKVAMDFFKKYETGGGTLEFAKDFGYLKAILLNRIRREESSIYKEYERRNGG